MPWSVKMRLGWTPSGRLDLGRSGGMRRRAPETSGRPGGLRRRRRVQFVAFDVSSLGCWRPWKTGQLQGTVAQNPIRMGELGVRSVVDVLEKKPVPSKVTTGETLVTPDNLKEPGVESVLHPPRVDGRADAAKGGAKAKKWQVMVIPKGTTHEFWQSVHAGAVEGGRGPRQRRDHLERAPARGRSDRPDQARAEPRWPRGWMGSSWRRWMPGRWSTRSSRRSPGASRWSSSTRRWSRTRFRASSPPTTITAGCWRPSGWGNSCKGEGKIILLRYMPWARPAPTTASVGFLDDDEEAEFPKVVTFLSDDQYAGRDLRPGPAEGAEPPDPVPGPIRRGLLLE